MKTHWRTFSCWKHKPENLHWHFLSEDAHMNGCLIPPTMAQNSTGNLAPVWHFLNCPVVKQSQLISSLVGFPLENLGIIPVKSPTLHPQSPHKPGRTLPTQRKFIYKLYQRKENLPHYISFFLPCPPCQSLSSVQFAIPAIVKFRSILTN